MNKKDPARTELIEPLVSVDGEPKNPRSRSAQSERAELDSDYFFAHSIDLLCIAGFDGHFKRLNPAWTSTLGWTLQELEATPFLDFVHPEDREATQAELAKLTRGADRIFFENRYRHQNGSYRWLQWNAHPVPGRMRIYATARDITGHKRLESSLDIADRENLRVKSDLHDGLCQTLAGIAALSATLCSRLMAQSDAEGSAAAAEITKLLNEAIGEARDLAHGLGPAGLKEAGLARMLGELALTVRHLFRVSCALECDAPFPRLEHEVEVHLYRIAQEAMHNAVAHGRAEWIEIGLGSKDGQGFLSVRDNGVGVTEEALQTGGIGVQTMAYRARVIGAVFEVRSLSPRGTALTCAFPLPDTPATCERSGHAPNER
ncbi:MAG: PAS domain S-box protein [Burkholderiales bacterium]|nr:PAS domain S-box protein [Burkholderiales bacterium]